LCSIEFVVIGNPRKFEKNKGEGINNAGGKIPDGGTGGDHLFGNIQEHEMIIIIYSLLLL
jgi:hypothetical protein